MRKRFLQLGSSLLLFFVIANTNFAQNTIVHTADANIVCSSVTAEVWTTFYSLDAEWYYGVWYDGGTLRLETYGDRVIGESIDVSTVNPARTGTSANISLLEEGTEIGSSNSWSYTGEYPEEGFIYHSAFTDWTGKTGYAGVEFNFNGTIHYMWLKFQVASDGSSMTLLEYAVNSTPGASIKAGETDNSVSGVEDLGEIPMVYSLQQNYPNPFNPTTNIQFAVPQAGNVNLSVFNALGQRVAELVNENYNAGTYTVDWNASDMPSGIYIYKITTNNFTSTKKMLLLK